MSIIRYVRDVRLIALASLLVVAAGACGNGTSGGDPELRLGSAGLRRDIDLTAASGGPEERRVRSTDEILLGATASDRDGVRHVRLAGELLVTCVPRTGNTIVRIRDPIAADANAADANALPVQLAKQFVLDVPDQRARCPQTTRFLELVLRAHAESETASGTFRTPDVVLESYGPDSVRVASYNLWNPGNHADDVFTSWGTELFQDVDVALLQEVPDEGRARLLAAAAGMPYVAYYINTAVASRAPLRDLTVRNVHGSIIVSAITDLGGHPHQVISTHFTFKGPGNVTVRREDSSEWRVDSAQELLTLLEPSPGIVVVGGDFNAHAATEEMRMVSGPLTDVFASLGLPGETHCWGPPIDFLLMRGSYTPAQYGTTCQPGKSDHPFVWARLDVE